MRRDSSTHWTCSRSTGCLSRTTQLRYFAVGLLAILPGCSRDADTGFLKKVYTTPEGAPSHYVVYVPENAGSDAKLPVILFLNGWGENGDDGLRQISNNFGSEVWRMRTHFPFLAVCPQCSPNGNWQPGGENAARALAILDEAIDLFRGDPDRVCVTGASVGGSGALQLATAYPERFAAVVPVAAGGGGNSERLAARGMPIWSFYNGDDVVADGAHRFTAALLAAGASPRTTEYQRSGHNSWDSAYASPVLYHWLLNQRVSTRGKDHFDSILPERLLTDWTPQPAESWTANSNELVFTPVDSATTARLQSPAFVPRFAVHFDIYLKGDDSFEAAMIAQGNDSVERLSFRLAFPNNAPSSLKTTGEAPTLLDPIAQRGLVSGWNHLRLEQLDDRLTLSINGWPAFDVALPAAHNPHFWRFEFDASSGGPKIRFIRTLTVSSIDPP